MKKTVWLCFSLSIALFLFEACKARKVSITRLDSTNVTHISIKKDSSSVKKDTNNIHVNQVTVSSDSGTTVTTITADSGKTLTDSAGVIKGASKIVKKHNYVKKKRDNQNSLISSGSITSAGVTSSTLRSDSVHVDKKVKTVDAKPTYGWIIYAVIGLLVLLIFLWKAIKF